ncbi:efflux RND transporter permease subunit, partial [Salmonella enterica]|uniref:efflux RND transporter permease subunit n=1 Tax=Salmonella enterica TaxID=28901 RepID=UPI003D2A3948
FTAFNRRYDAVQRGYQARLAGFVARPRRWLMVFLAICALGAWLDLRLQTSFLPEEDQGNLQFSITMPSGTAIGQTRAFAEG